MSDKEPPHQPTTREYFAGLVMVAILETRECSDISKICQTSVEIADQLIKELNK